MLELKTVTNRPIFDCQFTPCVHIGNSGIIFENQPTNSQLYPVTFSRYKEELHPNDR